MNCTRYLKATSARREEMGGRETEGNPWECNDRRPRPTGKRSRKAFYGPSVPFPCLYSQAILWLDSFSGEEPVRAIRPMTVRSGTFCFAGRTSWLGQAQACRHDAAPARANSKAHSATPYSQRNSSDAETSESG